MAGRETSKGAASSPTVASPRASVLRIARRVGSASAAKMASRRGAGCLTTWLSTYEARRAESRRVVTRGAAE